MPNQNGDGGAELHDWLQTHSKTIPSDLPRVREILPRFPREKLDGMTLEEYAWRYGRELCYWLEFKSESSSVSGGFPSRVGCLVERREMAL